MAIHPKIRLSRGDTEIKTQYNGGFKWLVKLSFQIDEDTEFESAISMTFSNYHDSESVHYHVSVNHNPPLGYYNFSHQYLIHPLDASNSENGGGDTDDLPPAVEARNDDESKQDLVIV